VSGMYCYCDQNGTVHTWHPCICNLECPLVILWSDWNSTYLTPLQYVSWKVCTVPFWSQYHKKRIPTYICRGVRYVLFHYDHSIKRRGFQLTYAWVSGMYCSILITVSLEGDSNLHMRGCQAYASWNPLLVILWSEWNSTYLTPLHM
jgi:hypothetical protein